MKLKFLSLSLVISLTLVGSLAQAQKNCDEWLSLTGSQLTLGAAHYDKLTPEFFREDLTVKLKLAKQNLRAIKENDQPPTFANTIEALEYFRKDFDHAWGVFGNYLEVMQRKEFTAIHEEFSWQVTQLGSSVLFDVKLFRRVEKLYYKRHTLGLNKEQMRLLQMTYNAFLKNGVNLDKAKQERLNEIKTQLSLLGEKFKINATKESSKIGLLITDTKDLAGLPNRVVQTAAETAKEMGHEGAWVFLLEATSYTSFMRDSDNRELRQKLWTDFSRKNTSGEFDNRALLLKIAKLRHELAQILGSKNYAELILKERMAKKVENVTQFLNRLAEVYKPHAVKDLEELEKFAGHKIEPWDVSYYSKRLAEKKFDLDYEKIREYLPFDQALQAAFYVLEKNYKVRLIERKDLPVWQKDVRAFEVRNPKTNELVALFYLDPFPRKGTKRGGAYSTVLRPAGRFDGKMLEAHVINVLNSTPPTEDKPSLLSIGEGTTIFHELGHGLHQMLTRIGYPSIAGTEVAWDGVELPSQLNEKWLLEVLNRFGKHYKTKEAIPQAYIDKIIAAENFQAAMMGLTQVSMGLLDMAWYTEDLSKVNSAEDVEAFEERVTRDLRIMPWYGQLRSVTFSHIFAGGYAAGYYSYRWADALVATAHALFKKHGMFNEDLFKRYIDRLLSQGNIDDFDVLYRDAFGTDPNVDDLLRSEGMIP